MPDSSQVEVKMVVNLNAIVLENQEENIITDIQEHELEEKKIRKCREWWDIGYSRKIPYGI